MATVKCPICGKGNKKEDTEKVGKRYCCKEHAEQYQQELENKKTPQDKGMPGYPELIELVCTLCGIKAPTGMILRQIQNYRQTYNFTYEGMRATVLYCTQWATNRVELNTETGLSFIPYRYDEARHFYEELQRLHDYHEAINVPEATEQERVVKINVNDLRNGRQRVLGLVDIESLGGEE